MTADILLVDDDPIAIQLLAHVLRDMGALRFATSGEEALRLANESAPDLILLDAEMSGMSGFRLCAALKATPSLADVPVIFVTSHGGPAFELSGFDLGAADFIAKPINAALLLARVRAQLRLKHTSDEWRRMAAVDGLTGVANRRQFDQSLAREWRRARRAADPLALLMIDVDHFKPFNDRYGHPAGDACLRQVARAIQGSSVRPADLVARYGGDEFVMLLPQTPRRGSVHVAIDVLKAVKAADIAHATSTLVPHVTVTVGIACYDEESVCWEIASADSRSGNDIGSRCSPASLMQAADQALYAAKHAGRACARLLDIADVDAPLMARDVALPGGYRRVDM